MVLLMEWIGFYGNCARIDSPFLLYNKRLAAC